MFDAAVFDTAVFDAEAPETQKRLWQFYRNKRDRENAAKVVATQIEAIREAEHARVQAARTRVERAQLALSEHTRLLEMQAQEDEEAAHALMVWLLS